MRKIFAVLFTVVVCSISHAAPINYFTSTVGLDDRGLKKQCKEAERQATHNAMSECRDAGYLKCEVFSSEKIGYWKDGLFDKGFCKYEVTVRGMDDLERDAKLFKFSGFSQFRKCENNTSLVEFTEGNVLAECKLKFRKCEIVFTRIIQEDIYGCGMESVARGLE